MINRKRKRKGNVWMKKAACLVLSFAMILTMLPERVSLASEKANTTISKKESDTSESSSVTKAEVSDSTLEQMGMKLDVTAGKEGENPYGNGYKVFNPISELYVASSNGKSYVKDNLTFQKDKVYSSSTQLSRDTVGDTNDCLYSTTTAFNAGSGKDDMVARCYIGTNKRLYLTVYGFNESKNRVQTASFSIGNCNKIFKLYVADDRYRTHQWEMDAYTEITPFDMDGDGVDELAVYDAQNTRVLIFKYDDSSKNTASTSNTTSLKHVATVNVNNVMSNENCSRNKMETISLTAGDLTKDNTEELVVVENKANEEKSASKNIDLASRTYVYDYNAGELSTIGFNVNKDSYSNYFYSYSDEKNGMAYASASIGDIDGNDIDELVIAGRQYTKSNGKVSDTDARIATYTYDQGSKAFEIHLTEQSLKCNGSSIYYHNGNRNSFYDMSKNTGPTTKQPIAVECAATSGTGCAETIMIDGSLFLYAPSTGQLSKEYEFELDDINQWNSDDKTHHSNKDKQEMYIDSVIVGNFDGNAYGQEQIIYTYAIKSEDTTDKVYKYWLDTCSIRNVNPGTTTAEGTASYKNNLEKVVEGVKSGTSAEKKNKNTNSGVYLDIAAVDVDSDSSLAVFESKDVTYAAPEVLAVLQSAPYFEAVEKETGGDYPNNSETAFGKTSGSSKANSVSASISAGLSMGYENDVSVFGCKLFSYDFEIEQKHSFGYEYEHESEVSTEVSYSQGAGADSVVVFTTPYVNYHYKSYIPEATAPASDKDFEAWLVKTYAGDEDAGITAYADMTNSEKKKLKAEIAKQGIKPGAVLKGHWDTLTISVPKKAITTQMDVSDYDEIASQTKGMTTIRNSVLTNKVGNPATYNKVNSDFERIGELNGVGHADKAIKSITKEVTSSKSNSFTYEMEEEVSASVGVGGTKAGVSAGFSFGTSVTKTNFEGVSYTGAVDSLPTAMKKYDFNWEFGLATAKVNGNKVPVLGYRVSDVTAPLDAPENFMTDEAGIESMKVNWDSVDGAAGYNLYVYDKNEKDYVLVDKVPAGETSYTYKDLLTGCKYNFGIEAYSSKGSLNSPMVTLEDNTMPANALYVSFDTMPGNVEATISQDAVFNCQATYKWNSATSANNSRKYIWQKWNQKEGKWDTVQTDTTGTLTVKNVSKDDDGSQYRCKVSFSYGTIYVYSDTVTLSAVPLKTNTSLTVDGGHNGMFIPTYENTEKILNVGTQTVTDTVTVDDVTYVAGKVNATASDGKTVSYTVYKKADDVDNTFYNIDSTTTPATVTPYKITAGKGYYIGDISGISLNPIELAAGESYQTISDYTLSAEDAESGITGDVIVKAQYKKDNTIVNFGTYTAEVTETLEDVEEGDETTSTETKQVEVYLLSKDGGESFTLYSNIDYESDSINLGDVVISTMDENQASNTVTYTDAKAPVDSYIASTKTTQVNTYTDSTYTVKGDKVTLKAKVSNSILKDYITEGFVEFICTNEDTGESNTYTQKLENGEASREWVAPETGKYTIRAHYCGMEAQYSSIGIDVAESNSDDTTCTASGYAVSFYNMEGNLISKQYAYYGGTVDFPQPSNEANNYFYHYYIGDEQISENHTFTADTKVTVKEELFAQNAEGYYEIYSADQLRAFAEMVNKDLSIEYNAKLMSDIDLQSKNFTPIGGVDSTSNLSAANQYRGIFDGNGHSISNLNVSRNCQAGLFGASIGTIKNLVIESGTIGANVTANVYCRNGGIVGINYGLVENCINKASISGSRGTGGIAGTNEPNAIIKNCINYGEVRCYNQTNAVVGGIVGQNTAKATTTNCISAGKVAWSNNANSGAVVGLNQEGTLVSGCYYINYANYENATDHDGTQITEKQLSSPEFLSAFSGGDLENAAYGLDLTKEGTYPELVTKDNKVYTVDFVDGTDIVSTQYVNKGMKADKLVNPTYIPTEESIAYYTMEVDGKEYSSEFTFTGNTKVSLITNTISQDQDDYYKIGTPKEYYAFANASNAGYFQDANIRLTANLDLGTYSEIPSIGTKTAEYQGIFDGNNKTISNLSTVNPMFAYISGATVKNMVMKNMNGAHGIIGVIQNNSAIVKDITLESGTYEGSAQFALSPLIEQINSPSGTTEISDCINNVTLNESKIYLAAQAGIVGFIQNASVSIKNCENRADINGISDIAGGIIGQYKGDLADAKLSVINCTNSGDIDVRGYYHQAGIIAELYGNIKADVEIKGCTNSGNISRWQYNGSAARARMGGIVGVAGNIQTAAGSLTITDCVNTGNVISTASGVYIGGIAAYIPASKTIITNCYNTGQIGKIGLTETVGGITSCCESENAVAEITNCYNSGQIYGHFASYLVGNGTSIGKHSDQITVTNSYVDKKVKDTLLAAYASYGQTEETWKPADTMEQNATVEFIDSDAVTSGELAYTLNENAGTKIYGQLLSRTDKNEVNASPVLLTDANKEEKSVYKVTYMKGRKELGTVFANAGQSFTMASAAAYDLEANEGEDAIWEDDDEIMHLANGTVAFTMPAKDVTFKFGNAFLCDKEKITTLYDKANQLVSSIDSYEGIYTKESWEAFKVNYDIAKDIVENQTLSSEEQSKVDDACDNLQTAYDGLVKVYAVEPEMAQEGSGTAKVVNAETGVEISDINSIPVGTKVTVTAVMTAGKTFNGWYAGANLVSEDESYTFVVADNEQLTVQTGIEPVVNPTYTGAALYTSSNLPKLTLSDTDTEGTIALDEGQQLVAGEKEYTWSYIPVDAATYLKKTGTIKLNVKAVAPNRLSATINENSLDYETADTSDIKKVLTVMTTNNDGTEKLLEADSYELTREVVATDSKKIIILAINYNGAITNMTFTKDATVPSIPDNPVAPTAVPDTSKTDNTVVPQTVAKVDITGAQFTYSKNVTYSGKMKTPVPTITKDGKTLVAGTDYTVSYQNNKNVGQAEIAITGIGNYTGAATFQFNILPKAVKLKSAKASGKKSMKISWKKVSKATGYRIYISTKKNSGYKKVASISKGSVTKVTLKKLKKKTKYFVKVKTIQEANGVKYISMKYSNIITGKTK